MSQGTHTFEAFDGAASFASVVFQVVHFGVEFKTGVTGSGTATLSDGSSAELVWSQALQGFPITKTFGGFSFTTLLGKWRFTSGSLLILGNDYDLQRIVSGDPSGIIGEDIFGDLIVVVKTDSSFGEFFLIDEGSTLCRVFFFNQTTADRVEGIQVNIDRVSGECVTSTILSGPTDMIGFGLPEDFDISFPLTGPTETSIKALHESYRSSSTSPASPELTLVIEKALSKINNLVIP